MANHRDYMKDMAFSQAQIDAAESAITDHLARSSEFLVLAYLMGSGGQSRDWLDTTLSGASERASRPLDETERLTRIASEAMARAAYSMGVQDLHHTIAGEDNLS